jgi:hypothetical protein
LPSKIPTVTPKPTIITKNPIATVMPTVRVILPTEIVTVLSPTVAVNNTPTNIPPIGPAISYAFTLPGIGPIAANLSPTHATKQVSVFLYPADTNTLDPNNQPSYAVNTQAMYDNNPSSITYGDFVLQNTDLGANVPAGDYQIAFKTDQTIRTLIKDSESAQQGTVFQLTPGQVAVVAPQVKNVLVGDLNGDNIIDIKDYNLFVNCFESKVTEPTCSVAGTADFNDDAVIDGLDYNLMLKSIQSLLAQGNKLELQNEQPTTVPIETQTFTPYPTRKLAIRPTISLAIASNYRAQVKHNTPTPTPVKAQINPLNSLFASENTTIMSKLFSYLAFFLLIGIGIFGAYKSRIITAILHRGEAKEGHVSAKTAIVSAPILPPGKTEVTKIYYLSNASGASVGGKYSVTLTDNEGSRTAYITQVPPQDGYYLVTGYDDENNDIPNVMILSLIPASKPTNPA